MAVNCAAIPETLIESELFGHEKGSFTGATSMKRGQFEQADGGTLFLDEIADMSLNTQAKVLRVLQEQQFTRVGGTKLLKVDVRVLAASNKDLLKEIEKGAFREDLFYRLNVVPIIVPPLRERRDDIPLLVRHFMKVHADEQGLRMKEVSPEAMAVFQQYDWPGNIRELRNLIERLMIMVPGPVIEGRKRASRCRLVLAGRRRSLRLLFPARSSLSPMTRSGMRATRSRKSTLPVSCVSIIGIFPARRKIYRLNGVIFIGRSSCWKWKCDRKRRGGD